MLTQDKSAGQFKGMDLLKRHEGFQSRVYTCPAGRQSIGYGYNLEANPLKLDIGVIGGFYKHGITKKAAEILLVDELKRLDLILAGKLGWWSNINEARQSVLLNMAYNLGINGLLKFSRTLGFIEQCDYAAAAHEMLDSNWAKQVHGRANELALIMKTGALR
jgi:lysozyme